MSLEKFLNKSEAKKGKKPPSIEINYKGMGNNITTLNDSCPSKRFLKKYLNPNKVVKNKSSSLIKRFAVKLAKNNKKKFENKKSKNHRKTDKKANIDNTLLINSVLNNEDSLSPKSHKSNPKGVLNRSLKKRRNSNAGKAVFNMTGNFRKKRLKAAYNSKRKVIKFNIFRIIC